ncbi:PREDICTED: putative receptor protein kinase ZmPK1-like [Fragaria vesca subsp. vesca]
MGYDDHQRPKFPSFLIFCFITLLFHSSATAKTHNTLQRGSSLSVKHGVSEFLTSPDNSFTCGFYGVGTNAYWFSIWFTNSKDKTLVWMANRNRPVNGLGSKASLTRDGSMVLTDVDGTQVWSPTLNSSSANLAESAELLNSGNLVLRGPQGEILWQSFDFPTHTLLPNQLFTKDMKLVSNKLGKGDFGSGFYNLNFDSDNVLRLVYDGPDMSSVYWPDPNYNAFKNGRTNYNSSRIVVFDDLGRFLSSDGFEFSASDMGLGIKRRLTMDYDGNLRLYSLNATGFWVVTWEALSQNCRIHGICGRNGICVYTPEPKCSCPPGYEVLDKTDWNKGCKPKFNLTCSDPVKFIEMPNADFYGFDVKKDASITLEACRKLCIDDCRCQAFRYKQVDQVTMNSCFIKDALFNGHKSPYYGGTLYLKVPLGVNTSLPPILSVTDSCMNNETMAVTVGSASMYDKATKRVRWVYLYSFAYAVGAVEFLFIVSGWCLLFRRHGAVAPTLHDDFRRISSHFRMYLYSELKKATQNFKEELGRGASGRVYKGVLEDKRVVAVKKLEEIYHAEEVFWAEVTTIGKIHHMNLVRTWGFCSENNHRLLISEFIENGSLDKHLFSSSFLAWKERFKVALGIAKGLAYLHHECLEWVIHCDVKPENVLLNSEFEPKIADFGLAKLSQRGSRGSHFSQMRGTKGYMAPEWASNLPITAKVDVYSYGVMILEIVKGIRLSSWVMEGDDEEIETEMTRFIREVKHRILLGEESWIEEMVDPRLDGEYNRSEAAKMVEIGISCVEEDRSKRPTMDAIVQILLEC